MTLFHEEKLTQSIKDIASSFAQKQSNGTSLITITRVVLNPKGDRATIFVSVFPEDKEEAAVSFLVRNRGEFKDEFKAKVRVGRIPFFEFVVDKGEKLRQKIDLL